MISYLGSLVQFSPAKGRVGRCRQISQCVGSTPCAPATLGLPHTGVSVLSSSTLLRLPAALYGAGPALRAVPIFGSSTKTWIRLCLRFVSSPASVVQAAKGLGLCSPDKRAISLCASSPGKQRPGCTFPRCVPFPSAQAAQAARGLGALSPDAARLFPRR